MPLNGVKIGLDMLYYALLVTDASDGASYDTPVRLTGAIEAVVNPGSSIGTLFGDNAPLEVASQLGTMELSLNVADLPLADYAVLLGHTITAGVITALSTASPPWVAVGFRAMKSNGSYRYVWLLKGKFQEPEDTHETKNDTVNFQTASITANFVAREFDKGWKKIADEDEPGYVDTTGTNWFTTNTLDAS